MILWTLYLLVNFSSLAYAAGPTLPSAICHLIQNVISSKSNVYFPGSPSYDEGISHFFRSSAQSSTCVVEPGSAVDVGKILRIVGSSRTPFAVKGGGHAYNVGVSSTLGVQISMKRFSRVTYNPNNKIVTFGSGLIWEDVYAALEPFNRSVAGGRVAGVGVAGLTLGGGYSWHTNQVGLTVDTAIAYELVKPNGQIVTVTQTSDPELFFGLKGGYNNFGIITAFTLKTLPQTLIWGGFTVHDESAYPALSAATARFQAEVTDPKAQMILTFAHIQGQNIAGQVLFYDAPNPPSGIFDDLLAVPSLSQNITTQSLLSLVAGAIGSGGQRGRDSTVSILSSTRGIIDAMFNETKFWGQELQNKSAFSLGWSVEPFLPNIWDHATSQRAYPPQHSPSFQPFNLDFQWTDPAHDQDFFDAVKLSTERLKQAAVQDGQIAVAEAPVYPNYALPDTPLEDMYGNHVKRLKALKGRVDPTNVMGLAGGFKF